MSTGATTSRTLLPPTYVQVCSVFAMGVAGAVLVGWFARIEWLRGLAPGWPTMKVNTAIGVALLGAATWAHARPPLLVRALALGAFAIGMLSGLEWLTGAELGIDELLLRDEASRLAGARPGLMSLASAVGITLVATAILAHSFDARVTAQIAAGSVVLLTMLPMLSYSYEGDALRNLSAFDSMAAHTAISLGALAVAWLLHDGEVGTGRMLGGEAATPRLMRWLGVPLLCGSWLIGLLAIQAQKSGAPAQLTTSVQTVANVVLALTVISFAARALARAEASLARGQGRWALVVDTSPDAILLTDPDDRIEDANPAASRLLGIDGEALVGSKLGDLLPPATAERHERAREASATAWEGFVQHGDTSIPIEVRRGIAPGDPPAHVTILRDVSRRGHLEEQLRRTQKLEAVSQLAGGVAHDFNNLLSVVISYVDLLRQQVPNDPMIRDDLEAIHGAATRGASLSRQLLAFSRQQVLRPTALSISQVVRQLSKVLERTLGEDVSVGISMPDDEWKVWMDAGHFDQILLNLATNARHAMPHGGRLTLEVRNVVLDHEYAASHPEVVPGEHVLISVTDSGEGIPAEVVERIFEPFFTTRLDQGGTGLGLSMCYGIVRQLGGHLLVYSELGKGTCFKIYLPRFVGDDPPPPAVRPRSEAGVQIADVVLLVEDEPGLRTATARLLRRVVGEVEAVGSGDEAEAALRSRGRVDVLISDVVLPGCTGPDVVARLRALQPDLPVVFVSGYSNHAVLRDGSIEADTPFVQKPFTLLELVDGITEALEQAETRNV